MSIKIPRKESQVPVKQADEASRAILKVSQEGRAAADMNSRGQTMILREDKQACDSFLTAPTSPQ